MTSFTPGEGQERAFRDALGNFATGVTIVTAHGPNGPCGITVNSFSSVSLSPPMVLWAVDLGSDRAAVFRAADRTAIHVMGAHQADIARRFAKHGDRFDGVDWAHDAHGVPVIHGALSRFDCRTVGDHPGGDHRILVSEVARVTLADGAPLVFARGGFGHFTAVDC